MSQPMTKSEAVKIAYQLLNDYQEEIGTTWTVIFNNRLSTTAGKVRYGTRTLELSTKLMAARTWEGTNQTIIHEVAHIRCFHLYGAREGHSPRWKAMFRSMGGHGNTHWQAETLVRPELVSRKVRNTVQTNDWRAICPRCQANHVQSKKPRRDRWYECRTCRVRVVWTYKGQPVDYKTAQLLDTQEWAAESA